jgi:hypothetical protein
MRSVEYVISSPNKIKSTSRFPFCLFFLVFNRDLRFIENIKS